MGLGVGSLIGEARLIRELLAFTGDTLRKRPERHRTLDSKPVLMIPGLLASDTTLYPIAARLRMAGCRVFFAGIWCNVDCPAKTIGRLERVLREAGRKTGSRVTVIGHSLGGIYARELARRFPFLVERAVLLGSPLRDPVRNSNHVLRAMAAVARLAHPQCLASLGDPCQTCGLDLPGKLPRVPETIIYTKSDGVVEWRSCLEAGPNVEAVEVESTHCGLSVSPEVCDIILARLERGSNRAPAEHPRHQTRRYRLFRLRPQIEHIRADARRRSWIDRVEIISHEHCRICDSDFASSPAGNKVLVLNVAGSKYFFCGACGDNIADRLESDHARKRYVWHWAVPLRENRASGGAA